MKGQDWNNLGSDLNRIIEDAVHMGNFSQLNRNINDTIRKSFYGEERNFSNNNKWDFDLSKGFEEKKDNEPVYDKDSLSRTADIDNAEIFASGGKRRVGSIVMLICGILLVLCSLAPLAMLAVGIMMNIAGLGMGSSLIFILMIAAGAFLIIKGSLGLRLAKRFNQHIRSLGGDTYIDVKKLALYCHRTENDVVKELKKMMKKGWFLQGHFDSSEKCFMVTNESYEQYLETVKNVRMQEEEKQRQMEKAEKKNSRLTPEVKAIIQKGNEYIKSIRESNDAIPGEQISEKIYRIEILVKRIFQQTENHPENVPDLRKLMEYYLPMTVKLLKAYEELDRQPVQGDNIMKSKGEIEDTLDTLNIAFEKLLDNLFQDTAWDVSADISVLNTMLAQEGLTDEGFIRK